MSVQPNNPVSPIFEAPMLKLGTPVRLEDGETGTIDRTSIRTGVKLYRVRDRWFDKAALTRGEP